MLNIVDIAGYDWISEGADTPFGSISGMGHLAFNVSAASPAYTIIDIDNIVLSDEGVALNQPNFINDLEITPAALGVNSATVSWVNAAFEADGGVLTDLDSVSVYEYGVWLGSVYNPLACI